MTTHCGIMKCKSLGFNYRLSDIHASLARSQLKRAKVGLDKRKEIATNTMNILKANLT